jgi:diguanylate cyclase (GGDEF)-like protein
LVLLEELDDETGGLQATQRIVAAIAEPISNLDQELNVTASVGVAFCQAGDEVDADELVRQADSAMYRVKHTGRNACAVSDTAGHLAS